MSVRPGPTVVGLFVLAMAFAPASASARIVPGAGIAGVRVGDSMGEVGQRLGKPKKVRPPAWVYGSPLAGQVEFDHRRRVKSIWTTSKRQGTERGIGPGSSLRSARRAYPRLHCAAQGKRRPTRCTLRRHQGKRTVATDFLFKRGRLWIVNVHLVPGPGGTPIPK